MDSHRLDRQKGFTLVEMLVTLAITSILVALVGLAFYGQSSSYNSTQEMMDLQQNIRSSLMFMAREIRMAGYDPTKDADATITVATASQFRFTQDITDDPGTGTSDGDTADNNEDIRFALNGTNLGRDTGGGLQTIADNIIQLGFEYQLVDDSWTQAPANLEDIRSVKIMMLGRSARETSDVTDTSVYRPPLESGAPPIWTPAAPGKYHWRLMSMLVQCRNMAFKE